MYVTETWENIVRRDGGTIVCVIIRINAFVTGPAVASLWRGMLADLKGESS